MSESVTLKSYFYEVLIPSSQKNTSSPIEDILHHVSKYIFYEKACALQMFQSTHPHGVRLRRINRFSRWYLVSIHAPTRGATLISSTIIRILVFQSTHPHGVRLSVISGMIAMVSFNPRTHTGCDRLWIYIVPCCTSFNPRTHTGCD